MICKVWRKGQDSHARNINTAQLVLRNLSRTVSPSPTSSPTTCPCGIKSRNKIVRTVSSTTSRCTFHVKDVLLSTKFLNKPQMRKEITSTLSEIRVSELGSLRPCSHSTSNNTKIVSTELKSLSPREGMFPGMGKTKNKGFIPQRIILPNCFVESAWVNLKSTATEVDRES